MQSMESLAHPNLDISRLGHRAATPLPKRRRQRLLRKSAMPLRGTSIPGFSSVQPSELQINMLPVRQRLEQEERSRRLKFHDGRKTKEIPANALKHPAVWLLAHWNADLFSCMNFIPCPVGTSFPVPPSFQQSWKWTNLGMASHALSDRDPYRPPRSLHSGSVGPLHFRTLASVLLPLYHPKKEGFPIQANHHVLEVGQWGI